MAVGKRREGFKDGEATTTTNTFFCCCFQSLYFISTKELDTDDMGPLGPGCVPGGAWPQPHQLHHSSIPAGGVASSLVTLRPVSRWPSSLGLAGSPQVGWCQKALPQSLLAPREALPAPW